MKNKKKKHIQYIPSADLTTDMTTDGSDTRSLTQTTSIEDRSETKA